MNRKKSVAKRSQKTTSTLYLSDEIERKLPNHGFKTWLEINLCRLWQRRYVSKEVTLNSSVDRTSANIWAIIHVYIYVGTNFT